MSCSGDACDAVTSKESDWSTADSLSVPQDFEGIVFVRAVDGSKPVGNTLEKSVRLTIRDDITTYRIREDIHDWTNIKDLNIQVTPSTNGLQELRYTAYAAEGQEGEPVVLEASDPENLLYTIRDIPEGTYRLKVIPIENGGTAIHRDAHVLRIDRTKPVVQVTMEQSSQDGAAKLMNRLTLNSFYRPGLMIRATASDQAGEQDIDPQLLKIEYSSNGTD